MHERGPRNSAPAGNCSSAQFRAEQRLRIQYAVASSLAEFDALEECANTILRSVCKYGDWAYGALWLVERGQDVIRCVETSRSDPELADFVDTTHTCRFPKGVGLLGRVWQTQRAEWLEALPADGTFPRLA